MSDDEEIGVGDLVALKDDVKLSSGIGLVLKKSNKKDESEDMLDLISMIEEAEEKSVNWKDQVPLSEPMVLVLWSSHRQKKISSNFRNSSVNFWMPVSDVRVVSKA